MELVEELFDFTNIYEERISAYRCNGLSDSDPSKVSMSRKSVGSSGTKINLVSPFSYAYSDSVSIPLKRKKVSGDISSSRSKMFLLRGKLPSGEKIGFFVKEIDDKVELNYEAEASEMLGAIKSNGFPCNILHGPAQKSNIIEKYVIMEELDGDLWSLAKLKLHPRIIGRIASALARRMMCLWSNRLVYTDMKPPNVAYKCKDGKFYISLIDLGDIFKLPNSDSVVDNWVATFPFYENENASNDASFQDKIKPITEKNAEFHMLWGICMLAITMLSYIISWSYGKDQNVMDLLQHNRTVSKTFFLKKRKDLKEKIENWFWYKALGPTDRRVWDMLLKLLVSEEASTKITLAALANPKKRKRSDGAETTLKF